MYVHVHKKRIGLRVKEAFGVSTRRIEIQPEDLEELVQRFGVFSKQLHHLGELLKAQIKGMDAYCESKLRVAKQLADMSSETILDSAINSPAENAGEGISFLGIHQEIFEMTKAAKSEFSTDIITRVLDWEAAVTRRVRDLQLFQESTRRDLEHYEAKVANIQATFAQMERKGKTPSRDQKDKLERNEGKLSKVQADYELVNHDLKIYLVEITDYGWKDLIPLFTHLLRWEMTTTKKQSELAAKLEEVVEGLKAIAEENKWNYEEDRLTALKRTPVDDLVTVVKQLSSSKMSSTPATVGSPDKSTSKKEDVPEQKRAATPPPQKEGDVTPSTPETVGSPETDTAKVEFADEKVIPKKLQLGPLDEMVEI